MSLAALFLISCSYKHDIQIRGKDPLSVEFRSCSEGANKRVEIEANHEEFRQLEGWFQSNRAGWDNYYATEPLGDYRITGKWFMSTVTGNNMVLNYTATDGEVHTLVKSVDRANLKFIDELCDA